MINKYTRTPQFEIEIRRPNFSVNKYEDELIATFGNSSSHNSFTDCLSYEYSESLDSPSTGFTMTLTLSKDAQGKTWLDKIAVRDLVFIKEHGKVRFVGYVNRRRYAARMGDKGAQRVITIEGMNLGNLLVTFSIVIDQHILSSNKTALTASRQFMNSIASKVEENQSLAELMKSIINSYLTMQEAIGGNQNTGLKQIIDNFFDLGSKFSTEITAKYPMVLSLYQTGENNLFDILQSIITIPFHELYAKWNGAPGVNKYEFIARPTPFDAVDWSNLPITVIPDDLPNVFLRDYDIGDSDDEVKTVFGVFLPGSGYSREKSLTLNDFSINLKIDQEKWPYYGYRPMFTELKFFNRAKEAEFQANELIKTYSQKLYDWFHNNPLFLSGTVTIMNLQNSTFPKYPSIGERLGFLGGEFYIESVRRSWEFGGNMISQLGISRGFKRDSSGNLQQPITNLGQKIGVLEVS